MDVPETSGAHAERTGKPSFPSLHARYARMNVLTRRICPYLSICIFIAKTSTKY